MISEEEYNNQLLVVAELLHGPTDVKLFIEKGKDGQYNFKFYKQPTLEDFICLAQHNLVKKVNIPSFYKTLKDIMDSAIQLQSAGQQIRYKLQKEYHDRKKFLSETYQKLAFKVVMPDKMTVADNMKYHDLNDDNPNDKREYVSFVFDNMSINFLSDSPAKEFFAFVHNKNCIIKGTFSTDKTQSQFMKTDTKAYVDLVDVGEVLSQFFATTRESITQKDFDDFWLKRRLHLVHHILILGSDAPLIMRLVDLSRKFLFDILIENHWNTLGNSKQEAKLKLKKDKKLIYSVAEKFGYIDVKDVYIDLEEIRNKLAHVNDKVGFTEVSHKDISDVFMHFVSGFIDNKFLQEYYKIFPYLTPLDTPEKLGKDYDVVQRANYITNSMDTLLSTVSTDLIEKGTKDKLDYLQSKGFLTQEQRKAAETVILKRNSIAHGQSEKPGCTNLANVPQVDKICHHLILQQNTGRVHS